MRGNCRARCCRASWRPCSPEHVPSGKAIPETPMKRSRTARLVLMGLAPVAISACSPSQEALVYQTVDECTSAGVLSPSECRDAQAAAQATAQADPPKYTRRADCVADFGEQQCATTPHSSGFFMPMMTGFLIARALDGRNTPPQPLYR